MTLTVEVTAPIKQAQNFPADPLRSGYIFRGWYTPENQYVTSNTPMPLDDLRLTAKWEKGTDFVDSADIRITASSWAMSRAKAEELLQMNEADQIKVVTNYAQAKAWNAQTGEDVPFSGVDVNALMAAPGRYVVSLTAEKAAKASLLMRSALAAGAGTIQINVDVFDEVTSSNGTIGASHFVYNIEEGALNEGAAKTHSGVQAFDENQVEIAAGAIQVNQEQLKAINQAISNGEEKTLPLTFTAQGLSVQIKVTLVLNQHTIKVSFNQGGTVSPQGAVLVPKGSNKSFTFTPKTGYGIKDVLVDGVSLGAVTSYEFTAVDKNHTLQVIFTQINSGNTGDTGNTGSGGKGGGVPKAGDSSNITLYLGLMGAMALMAIGIYFAKRKKEAKADK